MKKYILIFVFIISFQFLIVGCNKKATDSNIIDEEKIKQTIDLVLSYENGYDEIMKKHISETNFYICNYVEFYSVYIGDLTLDKYESNIISIKNKDDRYIVCMSIDMEGKALETHGDEEESDEVIGEDVPVEVILNERNGELYIEKFTEYESLEKAKELNEGFK